MFHREILPHKKKKELKERLSMAQKVLATKWEDLSSTPRTLRVKGETETDPTSCSLTQGTRQNWCMLAHTYAQQ